MFNLSDQFGGNFYRLQIRIRKITIIIGFFFRTHGTCFIFIGIIQPRFLFYAITTPNELLSIVKGLWERVHEKAEHQAAEYQSDADTQVVQMQQQFNQAKKLEADLQSTIHQLEEQLH